MNRNKGQNRCKSPEQNQLGKDSVYLHNKHSPSQDRNKIEDKRVEVNLPHLRKDLFLKHSIVESWLDKSKTYPNPTVIKQFGIDLVLCILKRKVLMKEDLLHELYDFEVAKSPKRSCSSGGGSPLSTPIDFKKGTKSPTRLSRQDGFYKGQDDLKTCLRFENDDIENDSREKKLLENHIGVLNNEIERLNLNDRRFPRDVQSAGSLKLHVDQYRSERNEARENLKKLVEDSKQYKENYERKIICMQYERQKAEEKVESLQKDAIYLRNKLDDQEERLKEMIEYVETYKRANDNQQKYILELQNRTSKQDDEVVKDAKTAIVHYTVETQKYKDLSEKAKSDNHRLKMEKEELQTLVQKLRTISKEEKEKNENEINSYNIKIKTLEQEKEEMVKTLEKQTAQLSLMKNKWKNMKDTRDQQDMKRHEQDCIKLRKENEALEDKLCKAEDQHAAEIRQHIESEKKLKNEMIRYRNERNRQQEKVKSLETEVGNLSSKLKEHQVLSTLENEKLQSSIKRLRNQLDYTETYQNNEIRDPKPEHRGSDAKDVNTQLYIENAELKKEVQDLRLKIRQSEGKNPCDISTLCAPERPSRLAESFQQIYDYSWNNAYLDLKKSSPGIKVIQYLLGAVKESYQFGERIISEYESVLDKALFDLSRGKKISHNIQKMNSDHARKIAKLVTGDISELFLLTDGTKYNRQNLAVQIFVNEVVVLCWRLINHDPPLKLLFDPRVTTFDTEWFEKYEHDGTSISYIVWPAIYREDNDNNVVIAKGIAEGN